MNKLYVLAMTIVVVGSTYLAIDSLNTLETALQPKQAPQNIITLSMNK